ncbi:POTRA domain-containing protein [Commensalibacter nepenthis]|uniref:POTRA domain-containing protein n=1 Tax=Commensalibacter nepenthis TaxID=3043872 RepID=A0ABT6Q565_9PROT|nr:POTRA domain-containing protein [Commensalibacter sp. TBRC 10068]MDI2112021.1 POTRA domain-containing protein [Commensalibacter sp. TBRC 10068]
MNTHSVSEISQGKTQQNTQENPASDTQEEYVSQATIKKISFTGNTAFTSQALQKVIPLKVGNVANAEIITNSMVKIAQLYKTKNIKITITPILEKKALNSTQIQFDIHEQQPAVKAN